MHRDRPLVVDYCCSALIVVCRGRLPDRPQSNVDAALALCDFDMLRLRRTLTYLLTLKYWQDKRNTDI